VIRRAEAADAAALGAMHARSWAETYPGLVPAPLLAVMTDPARRAASWGAAMAAPPLPGFLSVAEAEGAIIGFVSVAPARDPALGTDGEVTGLYLLRAWQGRGLGQALLGQGFAALRAAGFAAAAAWALDGNARARRFYARSGAIAGARRIEHQAGQAVPETAWVWRPMP
jgi:GNAT superfamily N-acetyltransferase